MRRILLFFIAVVFMTVTAVSPALAAQEVTWDDFTSIVAQDTEDCGENGWQILTTYQDYRVNSDSWVPVGDPYLSDGQWYQVYRVILGGIEPVGDTYVVESECFGEEEDDDTEVVQREAEASQKDGKDGAKAEKKDRKDRSPTPKVSPPTPKEECPPEGCPPPPPPPPPPDDEKKELPKTGGADYASLIALSASMLVMGSGLLLRRIYRR